MKLRTRIALIAAAAVAAAVILVSSVAYIAAGRELRSAIDKSLVERAIVIQQLANDPKSIIGDDLAGRPAYGIFGGRGAAFDTVYYQMTLSNAASLGARDVRLATADEGLLIPDAFQVGVLGEEIEVGISHVDGAPEPAERVVAPPEQRVVACEIVVDDGIVRP